MSDNSTFLHWNHDNATVKSVSTVSRANGTTLKIELHVTDGFTLAMLMQTLSESREQPKKASTPKSSSPKRLSAEPLLGLPAPCLQITDGGGS